MPRPYDRGETSSATGWRPARAPSGRAPSRGAAGTRRSPRGPTAGRCPPRSSAAASSMRRAAGDRVLRGRGAKRRPAHVREPDRGLPDRAVRALDDGRDRRPSPSPAPGGSSSRTTSQSRAELRHADLDEHLGRPDRGLPDPAEELGRRDRALARCPADDELDRRARGSPPAGRTPDRRRRASLRSCRGAGPAGSPISPRRVRDDRAVLPEELGVADVRCRVSAPIAMCSPPSRT